MSWRVDDDEPYRYECPDCGSVQVEEKKERYIKDPKERYRCRKSRKRLYYCRVCKGQFGYVIDNKNDTKR